MALPTIVLFFLFSGLIVDVVKSDANTELESLVKEFFEWRLQDSPEYATAYGFHQYDHLLEELTEEAFTSRYNNATDYIQRADQIDRAQLIRQNEISFDLLKQSCQALLDGYKYRRFGVYNFFTTVERPTNEWEDVISTMVFNTVTDYEKLISRLTLLPRQIDQMIVLMTVAINNRSTVHNASLTGAEESLLKMIDVEPSQHPLYEPFKHIPATIDPAAKARLESDGQRVINDSVIPAWQKMLDFIIEEYRPNTRPDIGATTLSPGGADYYQECLKWHTSTNLTPQQIHDIGLAEVARIKLLMENTIQQDVPSFTGSIRDYIDLINTQSSNFYNTSEELLNGYRELINETHVKLLQLFHKIPNVDVIVRASTNPEGSGGSYRAPPLDLSRPGEFIVNVFHPENEPKYDMPALTLHEAAPGHHTQAAYAIEANMAEFRRAMEDRKYNSIPFHWPLNTAYVEGWALYAESLGEEMVPSAYSNNQALFGRYAGEMFRACRLVLDTGMHALGWSKEKALDYFYEHTTGTRLSLETDLNRYISWPGQATAYKIGDLKIHEVRKNAEDKLGNLFDPREFHHQVLELGPATLDMLQKHIEEWVTGILSHQTTTMPASAASNQQSSTMIFKFLSIFVCRLFA